MNISQPETPTRPFLFVFDFDGTLTPIETLPLIARCAGMGAKLDAATAAARRGDEDYETCLRRRVQLLAHVSKADIENALASIPLRKSITDFIAANPNRCCIATSNFRHWIGSVLRRLPCRTYCSTERIDGGRMIVENVLNKRNVVKALQEEGYRVVFVGDGANDVEAMKHADAGIAIGIEHTPPLPLRRAATLIVSSEEQLTATLRAYL